MFLRGGDWRNLPEEVAKDYMGGSWLLGGGKTGMARRLSLDEPSLTLTCSPCQKQTERCHPLETRPLTVREYARIQTFPDKWLFAGTMSSKYKQIGNAVPVNLAWAVGRSLIRLFNDIQQIEQSDVQDCTVAVSEIVNKLKDNEIKKRTEVNAEKLKLNGKQIRQLDLYNLFAEYPDGIIPCVANDMQNEEYGVSQVNDNVLICYVKKDNILEFFNGTATLYYAGRRFPSTVELNRLCYFAPYLSGCGVRDLYRIKTVRVGTRKEGQKNEESANDYRLVFEIEFLKSLSDEYKKLPLEIWHTYTDMKLNELYSAF